ncbi:MAG: hypothetical protein IJ439_00900 [Tyzzerella sp.]|nr:hypothetical protein [Tyzzerella sp.]
MGAWEAVREVTKEYKDIAASIAATESIGDAIIRLHDKNQNMTTAFTIFEGTPEWQIQEQAKHGIEKLRSKKEGLTAATLQRVEFILGFRLEEWQREYILSDGIGYVNGRRTGKTTAHMLKTLLSTDKPMVIYTANLDMIVDEYHGSQYERMYLDGLMKLRQRLSEGGLNVRKIKVVDGMRRDEGRMEDERWQQDGAYWTR